MSDTEQDHGAWQTEQDYGAWRTEQHRRAQAHAHSWAEHASLEYGRAVQHESTARRRDGRGFDHVVAEARQLAQFHGVRSVEAVKLAEMWARVARALADGELPVTNVLEVRGTEPARASLSDALADPNIVGRFR